MLQASITVQGRGLDPTIELVREEYLAQLKPAEPTPEQKSFSDMYSKYLEVVACKPTTKKKITITNSVWNYFCEFAHYTPTIESFDQVVFGQWVQYMLLNQKMADSTIHRHVKAFKHFLKWSYPNRNFSFVRYIMKQKDDEEVIALTEEELTKVVNANVSGYLAKTRDLFVFCATTGMRYCDSQLFDPSWVDPNNVLDFIQQKTGGKAYPPLYSITRKILDNHGGIPPQISNQKYNDYLKNLFEELEMDRPIVTSIFRNRQVYREIKPLSEVISSHTARRTFITICLQKGMPLQDVMKMSGHSDYRSMKPYIKVVKEHLRMVADKWTI
jgi:site-specific recombinase XerD